MQIKPYIALDLETTGLDPEKDQILEIGAVYDDGVSKIKDLKTFRIISPNIRFSGNAFALSLNSNLLKEISENKICSNIVIEFEKWIEKIIEEDNGITPTFAGKNVANFDIPFLISNGFTIKYHHRILDIGSCYYSKFGYIPSLSEINQYIGNSGVTHKALDDALDVVKAIRVLINGDF